MGKLTWPRIRRMLVFDWLWSTAGLIISHGSWEVFDAMFVTLPVVLFLVAVAWPAYLSYVHRLVERDRAALVVRPKPVSVRKLVDWREVARMELAVYGITKFHLDSPYKPGLTELPSRRAGKRTRRPSSSPGPVSGRPWMAA